MNCSGATAGKLWLLGLRNVSRKLVGLLMSFGATVKKTLAGPWRCVNATASVMDRACSMAPKLGGYTCNVQDRQDLRHNLLGLFALGGFNGIAQALGKVSRGEQFSMSGECLRVCMNLCPHGTDGGVPLFLIKQIEDQLSTSGWNGCELEEQVPMLLLFELAVALLGAILLEVCIIFIVGSATDENMRESATQAKIWVVKLIHRQFRPGRFEPLFDAVFNIHIKCHCSFFQHLDSFQ